MKHQPRELRLNGPVSVPEITHDGVPLRIEMNADLMASSGSRLHPDIRDILPSLQNGILRESRLPALRIDSDTSRSELTKRSIDPPFVLSDDAVKKGEITLLHVAGGELIVQEAMCLRSAGKEHHPAHFLIEPVNDK